MTVRETRALLDSPGGLGVDSKTVPVEMSTAGPGRLIMGEFSSTGSPGTSNSAQAFEGSTKPLRTTFPQEAHDATNFSISNTVTGLKD